MALASRPSPPSSRYPYLWILPTTTLFRLLLLVAFVVGLTLSLARDFPAALFPEDKQRGLEALQCLFSQGLPLLPRLSPGAAQEDIPLGDLLHRCSASAASAMLVWQLGSGGLLLVVAGVVFWCRPRWIIWRHQLKPLTVAGELSPPEAKVLADYIEDLRQERDQNELTARHPFPEFHWNPRDTAKRPGAAVFGRWGRYHVVLNKRWVLDFLLKRERPHLRSIVQHELAHIHHDGNLWAATDAVSYAALVVLVPLGLGRLLLGTWNLAFGVQIVFAALVYGIRQAILRMRELEADLQAADVTPLADTTAATSTHRPRGAGARHHLWGPVHTLCASHPTREYRQAVMADPGLLFRPGLVFWEAVGAGIVAIFMTLEVVLSFLLSCWVTFLPLLTSIVHGLPALWGAVLGTAGALGLGLSIIALPISALSCGLWRLVLVAAVTNSEGPPTPRQPTAGAPSWEHARLGGMWRAWWDGRPGARAPIVLLPALGLTGGLLVGLSLHSVAVLAEMAAAGWQSRLPAVSSLLGFLALGAGLLGVCSYLFLAWVTTSASAWIDVALAQDEDDMQQIIRRAFWVSLAVGCGMLAFWFVPILGVWLVMHSVMLIMSEFLLLACKLLWVLLVAPLLVPVLLAHLSGSWVFLPITVLGFLSLWAWPLSASWWQRRAGVPPPTVLLFRPSHALGEALPRPIHPGRAFATGLIGGLLYWGFLATLGVEILGAVHDAQASLFEYAWLAALVLPTWLLQVCVAALTARQSKRLAVVQGLFAAAIASVIALGGYGMLHVLQGEKRAEPAWWLFLFILMNNGGVLPALLAAWLATHLCPSRRGWGADGMRIPVPARLPRWHWGACCVPWLWGLYHKTYGLVLGCVPLLGLSLAIAVWGLTHKLHHIFWWFGPLCLLTLLCPWSVPWLLLSVVVGVWGIGWLTPATPPWGMPLLILSGVTLYALALLLALVGTNGHAWASARLTWSSDAHYQRVQQRWTRWGGGGLLFGFALVALMGFLDRPPQRPPQPFLLVPQEQGARSAPVPCLAGLVQAPAGGVVAVTCEQALVAPPAPVRAVQWLTLSSQAPLAMSTTSWGLPHHGVLLLPMPLPGPEVQGLTLETRTRLLLGERIWFPNRDATAQGGYQLVPGVVTSTAFDQVVVRLHQPIARQAQLGSPVLSQLTGHVIGFLAAWNTNTDTVMSLQLIPTWVLRQALVPPQDVLALRDVARQVASAAGAVPSGRGWLGVHVKNLSSELRQTFQVPTPHYGVLVHDVIADTPAHRAGIVRHDIILEFQGKQVLDKDALPRLVQAVTPGTTVEVVLWRQGTRHPVWVTLGSASDAGQSRDVASPPHDAPAVLASGQGRLDLQIQELTPLLREAFNVPVDIHGVLVSEVEAYAPAAPAGIERGDVLIAFQGMQIQDQDMQTFSRLVRAVAPGTTVEVVRWRQGSRRTLLITLGSVSDAEPQAMQRPQPHEGGPLPQAGQEQDPARAPDVTEDEVRAFVGALDAASHRKDADEFQTYFAPNTTVEITLHTPWGPHPSG